MITIEFKAENVSQLKRDIIAYAAELSPVVVTQNIAEKMSEAVSEAALKSDAGTVSGEPATKRGRPPKQKPELTGEKVPEAPPMKPIIPSDEEVQKALVAVNEKFGIDKAIECLNKFGVKRGRELTDAQKAPFVELCNGLLGK